MPVVAAGADRGTQEAGADEAADVLGVVGGLGAFDTEDDTLLAALRRVEAEADPVPERVLRAARLAITFRNPDGELAELVAVSQAESAGGALGGEAPHWQQLNMPESSAVRSGGPNGRAPLLLSFAGGGVHIDLEVTRRGDVVDVVGQLVGAAEAGCTIEDAEGRRDVELDSLGRFTAEGLRGGPIRLRCRSAEGGSVTTAWTPV